MSLVNDVLRDLDARQGGAAEVAGVSGVTTVSGTESNRSRRLLIFVIFVLAAICLALWLASGAPDTPSEVRVADPAPVAPPVQPISGQSGAAQVAPAQPTTSSSRIETDQSNIAALDASPWALADNLQFSKTSRAEQSTRPTSAIDVPPTTTTLSGSFSFGPARPTRTAKVQPTNNTPKPAQPASATPQVTAATAEIPAMPEPQLATPRQPAEDSFAKRERVARASIAAGDYLAAVNVLSVAPQPAVADNTNYYALLAAAQTSARQASAAAQTYRELLAVDPGNGTWWLGYGAALEASQQQVAARDALQRALASRTLRPDLRRQAAMRLQRLEQTLSNTP